MTYGSSDRPSDRPSDRFLDGPFDTPPDREPNRLLNNNRLVVSYLMLRKAIGCLGIALPFVLAIGGALLFRANLQETISDYYYTGMGDVFVGTLFAMGVFLFSYKGYGKKDNRAANIAAVCVIGTALFPTTPGLAVTSEPTTLAAVVGKVHIVFATLYFATLAYFSLFLFTKSDPTRPPTPRKVQRNRVYRICGYLIVWALVAIALLAILPDSWTAVFEGLNPIFWLESIAVIAFGVSWFVKGEGILEDKA